MKKRILLFTLIAGFGGLITSSYVAGPSSQGYDCSGADVNSGSGNPLGCSTGGTCHGGVGASTAGITVVLELDSAGVITSTTASGTGHYKPGVTYQVKITGKNTTTTTNLTKWGFQVAATKGATAATSPVNAGTLQSTGLPTGLAYWTAPGTTTTFFANVVGHNTWLNPASGTGGTGTTYIDSFTWTAPVAGTGTVSIFGALNAVNDNDLADAGDLWNTAQLVLDESTTAGIENVTNNISLKGFPNPVSNTLQLQMDNATLGTYALQVYGLDGRSVAKETINVNSGTYQTAINTANWAPGMYNVVITKDGVNKVIAVVKQ